MKFLHTTSITIASNRQRRVFNRDLLQDLIDSIEGPVGLLQPIVIRSSPQGPTLVAGERRLRAISEIYSLGGLIKFNGELISHGFIPVTDLGELSLVDAEEAELEENIRRADLTWQERATASNRLMNLRQIQAEEKGLPAVTVREVSMELYPDHSIGAAVAATRRELIVSRFLEDPAVRAAPTLDEAFKILKKGEERKKHAELAEKVGASYNAGKQTLIQADSQDWCRGAPSEGFEVILTDPPYGMGADDFGDSGRGVQAESHRYEDSWENFAKIVEWLPEESFRLATPEAHLYLFCDIDKFFLLRHRFTEAGWVVHRTPLVWSNPNGFRIPWQGKGPRRAYELILFARKGGKPVTAVRPDVMEYSRDTSIGHAAQKPVALLDDLLRRSARPGERVLDLFAGSGSVMEAAHNLKLPSTSIELDPAAFGIAANRLKGFEAQGNLPL